MARMEPMESMADAPDISRIVTEELAEAEERVQMGSSGETVKAPANESPTPLSYVDALRLRRRSGLWDYWGGKGGAVGST